MVTKEDLPDCPVAATVAVIGGKWKLLIIRDLQERPWRFNELKRHLTGISQKMLTVSLRELEEDGIVSRIPGPSGQVEYALTERGERMRPMLEEMRRWGIEFQRDLRGR